MMKSLTAHVVRAWEPGCPDRRTTDSMLLACVEHLIDSGSDSDRVILISAEAGESRAASLGLRTPYLVQPRNRFTGSTDKSLESVLRSLPNLNRIVLWSGLEPSELAKTAYRATGRDLDVATPDLSTLVPRRTPAASRREIRKALAVSDDEYLLALASDPPDAYAVHDFVRTCALVALVGRKVTAIVPRDAPEMERAKSTLRTTGVPVQLIASESPIWTLLPGCDGVAVDLREGSHPRHSSAFAQRWMAATSAHLQIPVVWPNPVGLGKESLDRLVLTSQSRLPVHIARAFNEHFLAQESRQSRRLDSTPPQKAAVA